MDVKSDLRTVLVWVLLADLPNVQLICRVFVLFLFECTAFMCKFLFSLPWSIYIYSSVYQNQNYFFSSPRGNSFCYKHATDQWKTVEFFFFFLVNKVKYKLIDFLPKLNIDLV